MSHLHPWPTCPDTLTAKLRELEGAGGWREAGQLRRQSCIGPLPKKAGGCGQGEPGANLRVAGSSGRGLQAGGPARRGVRPGQNAEATQGRVALSKNSGPPAKGACHVCVSVCDCVCVCSVSGSMHSLATMLWHSWCGSAHGSVPVFVWLTCGLL
jgi:hypothetical protein